MKTLLEYMMEAAKPAQGIIPMGKLEWKFKSRDYDIDEQIKCDGWNAGFSDEVLVFWSQKSDWMLYVYLDEVRKNRTNWALVSLNCKDSEVPSKVLANFAGYCAESATVPELDSISVPKEVEKMLDDVKKSKPGNAPAAAKAKPAKQELGDKISKNDFFKMFRPTGEKREASFGDRKALMDELWETSKIYCNQSYYSQYDTFYKVNKVNGDYVCDGNRHFDQWRDCHYYSQYVDKDDNIVWLMTGGKMD